MSRKQLHLMLNSGGTFHSVSKTYRRSKLPKRPGFHAKVGCNYETNAQTLTNEVLIKLAKVYNVSLDFIIGEGELFFLDKD